VPASPPRLDDPARRRPVDPARAREEYLSSARTGDPAPAPERSAARPVVRLLLAALVPLGLLVVTGLVLLWPSGPAGRVERAAAAAVPAGTSWPDARVQTVTPFDCSPAGAAQPLTCATAVVEVVSGADAGAFQQVDLSPAVTAAGVHPGDGLVLVRDAGAENGPGFAVADLARSRPLVVLAVLFAAAVLGMGRLRGLAVLGCLAVTGGVRFWFELPALLRGEPATPVSLVGGAVLAAAVLLLLRGPSVRTATALLGTLAGLVLVGVVGGIATATARVTGTASGQLAPLQQEDPTLDLSGLVVAGAVTGALAVLAWLALAQTRAVEDLAAAEPALGWRELTARATVAGRARGGGAVVLTVLTAAGAGLPVLVLLELSRQPLSTALTGAGFAELAVRTLAAGTAVALAVPATTAVAAGVTVLARGAEGGRGWTALRARLSR
jgi:uncharacterized membrane protein